MEIIAGHKDELLLPDSHRHLPMQSQIALMFVVIMLVFGVFASLLNSWFTTSNFEDNLNIKSERYIQSIFNEHFNHHDDKNGSNFKNKIEEILTDKDIFSIGIYNVEKKALLYSGQDIDVPTLVFDRVNQAVSLPIITHNMRYYKYYIPPDYEFNSKFISENNTEPTQQVAYIVIAINEELVVRTALNAFVWTFMLTMLAATGMMLLAVTVIRRFTAPFDCLSKAMINAQLGQRGVRVKPDGASEVYKMGTSFNAMIAVLERREERLLAQKNNLEKQVKDRQTAEQALKGLTSRLQEIYNNVTDGIVVVDKYCYIVSMNPSANKIYGYDKGEIVGGELSLILKAVFINTAVSSLKGSNLGEKLANYETVALCKSGLTTPIEVGISRMDVSGEEHYLLTVRDIAERKRADEELNAYKLGLESMVKEQTKDISESRDAAMAGEKAMSTFLANMSHELRTPMHGVLSFANIALRKIDKVSSAKTKEYLNEIKSSGNNLLKIINDLLDLSKMKSGKMEYQYSKVIFSNIVNNVTREMSILAEKQRLSLNIDIKGSEVYFHFDESRMLQVVRNLYANAIKFAENDTTISVELNYKSDGVVVFTIFNYGVGVPEEESDSIFESFIQSSLTSNNAGGTGLGLPISKEIIEAGHDGKIYVDSNVNNGAKFIIEVPFVNRLGDDDLGIPKISNGR